MRTWPIWLAAAVLAACSGTDVPVPEAMTLNPTALRIEEGGTAEIDAQAEDGDGREIPRSDLTIAWVSANMAIATVSSSGSVNGIAPGTATISASAGKASATAVVTVLPRLAVASTFLAPGTRALPYTAQLTAAGGDGTYAWQLVQGSLPPGLSLAAGRIAGTPITVGTFVFDMQATSAGIARTGTFAITIADPPVLSTGVSVGSVRAANNRWECYFIWGVSAKDGLADVPLFLGSGEFELHRVADGAVATLAYTPQDLKDYFGTDRLKSGDVKSLPFYIFWDGPFTSVVRVQYTLGSPTGPSGTATTNLDCSQAKSS